MAEFTDEEKKRMALKAGIDSGVIDLYQAFITIYAMQNQINALITKVGELENQLSHNWADKGHS